MAHTWRRLLSISVVALTIIASLATVAFAAPDITTSGQTTNPVTNARKGPAAKAILAYIAGKANLDVKTLMQEYKSGKTLEEICAAHGVDWSVIQSVFAANQAKKGETSQQAIQKLEKRVANLLKQQANLKDKISKGEAAIERLAAKIETMKNATLKGFAERQLGILQKRVELGKQRLELTNDQLALVRDMLSYAKSV